MHRTHMVGGFSGDGDAVGMSGSAGMFGTSVGMFGSRKRKARRAEAAGDESGFVGESGLALRLHRNMQAHDADPADILYTMHQLHDGWHADEAARQQRVAAAAASEGLAYMGNVQTGWLPQGDPWTLGNWETPARPRWRGSYSDNPYGIGK